MWAPQFKKRNIFQKSLSLARTAKLPRYETRAGRLPLTGAARHTPLSGPREATDCYSLLPRLCLRRNICNQLAAVSLCGNYFCDSASKTGLLLVNGAGNVILLFRMSEEITCWCSDTGARIMAYLLSWLNKGIFIIFLNERYIKLNLHANVQTSWHTFSAFIYW